MFTSKFTCWVLSPLALVITSASVLTAFQSPVRGFEELKTTDSSVGTSRILSDAASAVPETHKNLSDTSRSLTDTKRILADDSPSNSSIFRSVRDTRRKLKEQLPADSLDQNEVSGNDVRFVPSRPIDAAARISRVQPGIPSGGGGAKLVDRSTSLKISDALPASGIPSEVASRDFEGRPIAYTGPQERTDSESTVEDRNQTIRNFLNRNDAKRSLSDSPPAFVNPEAFRVSPETAPSAPRVQGSFRKASTNKPVWRNLAQENVEEELDPLDSLTDDSSTRSLGGIESDSATRSLGDLDDIIGAPDTDQQYGDTTTTPTAVPSNVQQAIGYDPMSQAFNSHSIGDPYIASRGIAPAYRSDATQKVKTWRSPNLKHRPLYFEDAALERHGQSLPKSQPIVSGARFFGSVLLLPQKVIANPPPECVYPVGHGRPGNCTPQVRESLPRLER